MKRTMLLIAMMIVVIITSSAVFVAAQPLPYGGYSNPPLPSGSQYPSYPPGYPGQGNQQGPNNQMNNTNNQQNFVNHPSSGPSAGLQPQYTPSASTGMVAENLAQGQVLSNQQLAQFGGAPQSSKTSSGSQVKAYLVLTGLEQWAYYNGQWTTDPAAVNYNGYMNIVVNNDQGQYLWSYELYPNGYVDWHNWGYLYPGYLNRLFLGDASGWHQIAVWGSQSGWSNVLWIYVW
ncbi:MAG: hypothetical protein WB392_09795 [Methanotrichaceae archaeon]